MQFHLFDADEANERIELSLFGVSDLAESIRNGNGPSDQSLTWWPDKVFRLQQIVRRDVVIPQQSCMPIGRLLRDTA